MSKVMSPHAADVGTEIEAVPADVTAAAADVFAMPATQGQIRFWSLDQLVPGNPALNMPLMWRCTGPLNHELLTEAFRLAVERHESLRTTFAMVDGRLMQIIGEPMPVAMPVVALDHVDDAADSEEAGRLIREHAAFRFDLRQGPLLVLQLLRFDATHHMLLVTMHHIICDGISLAVLLRDLAELYRGLMENKAATLPELAVQFADFALYEQEWRASEQHDRSLEFWRKTLGTGFKKIELKRDREERPESGAGRLNDSKDGDIETLLLAPELTARAHQFCVRENVTFNILLTSIFCAWLHRLTGQPDLLIGSPCANRTEETEELIGLFMNIQVLRARIPVGARFRALLEQVRDWAIGAYEHQQLPFEDLVHDPYFSEGESYFELPVFFLYQKSFMVTQRIGELEIEPVRSMSPGAAFEFMFAIVDRDWEGPRLQLEYNPRYFRRETIRRYLLMFNFLLESALTSPDVAVEELQGYVEVPRALEPRRAADREVGIVHRNERVETEEYVGPRDAVERQLALLWQGTLGIPTISIRADFFELGVGSLAALRLISKVNRIYGLDLGLASLIAASSIESIATLVVNRLAPNTSSSVVALQPKGTRPPLFLIHGIGGNIVNFHGLAMRMSKDQPVYAVQAQSLLAGQPALLHMEDLAGFYLREIREIQPHGPYRFMGYSYGGTVALEMAHQLRAAGEDVAMLAMLDAKSHPYRESLQRAAPMQSKIGGRMQQMKGNAMQHGASERAAYLFGKVQTRGMRLACKLAAMAGLRQVPAFLKSAEDINSLAMRNYAVRPYDGRMILFRAAEQDHDNPAEDLGWGFLFPQGVSVHMLPGDHERIFLEPSIQILASGLEDCLREA